MQRAVAVAILSLVACLSGCAARTPAAASGGRARALETREGLASFYGREFHGRRTASGTRFDMNAMVAAHPSYPFGTRLRVTNLANGRSATVHVVDRGPSAALRADGLIIDVSTKPRKSSGSSSGVEHGCDWKCWPGESLAGHLFFDRQSRPCCEQQLDGVGKVLFGM